MGGGTDQGMTFLPVRDLGPAQSDSRLMMQRSAESWPKGYLCECRCRTNYQLLPKLGARCSFV